MSQTSSPDRPMLPPRLLPQNEAAGLLGIPPSRLDRWRREGRIGFVQLTRKSILYPEQELVSFIDANFHPATRESGQTLGKPKSDEHRRRIAEGQKAAWARRKAQNS